MTDSTKSLCVICGAGETGLAVAVELTAQGFAVTLVDREVDALEAAVAQLPGVGTVEGNCLSDAVLKEAGLDCAEALFAVLPDDRSNVFLSLSAVRMRPGLKIYSIASDSAAADKLLRVGVRRTVNPNSAEGLCISNQMIRPAVAAFLDKVAYSAEDGDDVVRYLNVAMPGDGPPSGTTLGELRMTELTGVVVVAVRRKSGGMVYSPAAEVRVAPGDHLIAFGTGADGERIARLLAADSDRRGSRS